MRLVVRTLLALSLSYCGVAAAQAVNTNPDTQKARAVIDASAPANNSDSTPETYPHVAELENTILGKSYPGEALPARLARMETKAFGKASLDPDLSLRTDALEQYAEDKLGKKQVLPDESVDNVDNSGAAGAPGTTGNGNTTPTASADASTDYPRITALEQAILGQTYPRQPLPDRLGRMEEKAFGAISEGDLSDRSDALERYAEKKLHKKIVQNNNLDSGAAAGSGSADGAQPSGQRSKQVMSMLGTALLGSLVPGFGGVRMRPRSAVPQQQQPVSPEVKQEDPLVLAKTPPPSTARMISKVGWCEKQIFGQTYPNMHLGERLGQLNRELNFEPGKADLALMDDIGGMLQAVQKRMSPKVGSQPQSQPQKQTKIGATPAVVPH